jgi:serine/threonine protein kinase
MANFFTRLSQVFQKNKTSSDSPDVMRTLGVGALINQRYRLDSEIGRGGMGIVYRAHDLANDLDVAVKVIKLDATNALSLQQFEREARILAKLHHPHIVTVYETGTVDTGAKESSPYIVMELVQGTSLLEMQGFTYTRIIDIGKQICEALKYAHDQGVIYRDLKPGNIILEKHGFHYFVKLLDFGLARPRGEAYLPSESSRAGTVFYLAPELIAGHPADFTSDLYALGATLYEMVTGRVPFSNFDEQNILIQHLEEPVVPPSHSRGDVPPALESIVLRLLEKNPKDRFATAQDVYNALENITLTRTLGNLPKTIIDDPKNEIGRVIQLLEENQLVTLLNGDKKLSLAVGTQLTDQFTDGVWLLELVSVDNPMLLPQTLASALGVQINLDRPLTVTLIETLREKNLLLLLDGCDHLIGACAQLAETILQVCTEIRILATSHKPLNVPTEKCFHSMDKPGNQT